MTFQDLRHDVGSQLAMAGIPLRTIADILGHRKLEMTLRYTHLQPGHLREAMTVLDQAGKIALPTTEIPSRTGTITEPA